MTGVVGRFGHHPHAPTDFICEVEALENLYRIANQDKAGHDDDLKDLDARIERALDFRTGADADAVMAKCSLRSLAEERGFDLTKSIGYAGQPIPRKKDNP